MPKHWEECSIPITDSSELPQKNVPEFSLYPLWESSRNREFPTSTSETLVILSPGIRNSGKGPDYRNCFFRKKGKKTIFPCDVEIHVKASDWITHQHHKNPDYGKVLLHVFLVLDTDITKLHYQNIFHIPFPNYRQSKEPLNLPVSMNCEGRGNFHSPEKRKALAEMGYRKLLEKGLRIHRLSQTKEQSLLASILRVHGQTKNSEIFLDTGIATLPCLLKLRHILSVEDIQIVLTGSSRLLHDLLEKKTGKIVSQETLLRYLRRWEGLQTEYCLKEIPYAQWEFHGVRPHHHPFRRFLQFSLLLKSLDMDSFMSNLDSHRLKREEIEPHLKLKETYLTDSPKDLLEDRNLVAYTRQMVDLIVVDGIIPWLLVQQVGPHRRLFKETLTKTQYLPSHNSKTDFFNRNTPLCFKRFTFLEAQGLIRLHDEFCSFRDISCPGCAFHPRKFDNSNKYVQNSVE